ncbi:MAG: 4-hydroxythreonine-4-phosphate dehydrogenase [Alphaproteobacteria bacterium]|nr:4-hydroxythreonine-4-phosphate dehydrogenase [Alphaproteobacteria bacterium]
MSKHDEGARSRLPIVISQGEPSGIGPEIAVKAWAALAGGIAGRSLHLIGSARLFREAAALCGVDMPGLAEALIDTGIDTGRSNQAGRPSVATAAQVTAAIERGVHACLSGEAAALVTAPIHKAVLTEAGFGFPGHTEYLAALTGSERAVMMLASSDIDPPLRVVPFTIHMPLREVFRSLDPDAIAATGVVVLDALAKDFGCVAPRLAIAGLNPHAGEDGTMGREDLDIIAPAVAQLRDGGHEVSGPLSADTMFHEEARKNYDAALCMYHDQALIPIKTLAFWTGVNVTLGLPIVRTSPDHGTALGIAGRGIANEASMIAAIRMAAGIADRRGL